AKVKERLLLVITVVDDGELPAHVVKGTHRSKSWGSYWLERYSKEGIKGLRNKPKSGRMPHIPLEISTRIRKTLRESRQGGWTTKQVNDLIVNESGIHYHYTHVYRLLYINGVLNRKLPRKVHVNTASKEEKEEFKKEQK
ncbi:MAG: helix-turn-helix domain-containing protein, partial [Nitrososphaeraceae archaeon]